MYRAQIYPLVNVLKNAGSQRIHYQNKNMVSSEQSCEEKQGFHKICQAQVEWQQYKKLRGQVFRSKGVCIQQGDNATIFVDWVICEVKEWKPMKALVFQTTLHQVVKTEYHTENKQTKRLLLINLKCGSPKICISWAMNWKITGWAIYKLVK